MQIQYRDVSTLVPYARNARTHSPAQVAQLAAMIREYGWTNALLIDGKNNIVAGHGRTMAATMLYEHGDVLQWADGSAIPAGQVPVILCDEWSDAQRRAYILADNKSALNAGWDNELLKLELQAIVDDGFNIELAGFDTAELSLLLYEPAFEPASEDEQGKLDEKAMKSCPNCGHEF